MRPPSSGTGNSGPRRAISVDVSSSALWPQRWHQQKTCSPSFARSPSVAGSTGSWRAVCRRLNAPIACLSCCHTWLLPYAASLIFVHFLFLFRCNSFSTLQQAVNLPLRTGHARQRVRNNRARLRQRGAMSATDQTRQLAEMTGDIRNIV